jgi:hypothetical protein
MLFFWVDLVVKVFDKDHVENHFNVFELPLSTSASKYTTDHRNGGWVDAPGI